MTKHTADTTATMQRWKNAPSVTPAVSSAQRTTSHRKRNAPLQPSAGLSDHIEHAKAGHEPSWAILIQSVRPSVDKIVNSRIKGHQCREDVTQEIWLKMFRKLHQYSGTVPLHHWASRIAVNACTDKYNQNKRRSEIGFADLSEDQAHYIETVKSSIVNDPCNRRQEARELVSHHLSNLKPADQLVIRLLYLEGLTHREISTRTGWTETLSKVRALRARRKLEDSIRLAESRANEKWSESAKPEFPIASPTRRAA